ncbi:MAG: C40 family peptidase [Propionibacteriaceae bacterium]|jgi:cell wall-associated NlpC family hydrolase|nr:C40 family peptidase [Propionibacteriaceae bacterium]
MKLKAAAATIALALFAGAFATEAKADWIVEHEGLFAWWRATTTVGKTTLEWGPASDLSGTVVAYTLSKSPGYAFASDTPKTVLYTGTATSFSLGTPAWEGEGDTYYLKTEVLSGGYQDSQEMRMYLQGHALKNVQLSYDSLRLNISDTVTVSLLSAESGGAEPVSYDATNLAFLSSDRFGNFTSSNPAVATVSATGKVTAVAGGKAVVTFTSWRGYSASVAVQVAKSYNPAYTANAALPAMLDQLKGRDNRLEGTIVSSLPIKAVTVKVFNGSKVERSITKKVAKGPTSYDLYNIRWAFPFKKLSLGAKTLKVYVKSAKGNALAGSTTFKVVKSVPKSKRAALAVQWALKRVGDKYSMAKRYTLGYADCSSMVQWAYKQVGVTIPSVSISQAQWVKTKKKSIKVDINTFKAGDLLFYDFPKERNNIKYVNHVDMYDGHGNIITASSSWNMVFQVGYGYNGTPILAGRIT